MIEPTGYTALDLVGFTDKGTYAANVNYVKNDLVHYGGNIWRILIDDTIGITPAEGPNYTLFIGEPTNLVESIIATVEQATAEETHVVGSMLIYNDKLYEVISAIAIGDTLITYEQTPATANIKLAPKVEEQIGTLKTSVPPVGAVQSFAAAKTGDGATKSGVAITTPTGIFPPGSTYIVCDGSSVNTADYPLLAAYFAEVYGNTYYFNTNALNPNNGTFKLPDWSVDFPENGVLCIKAK